MAHSFLDVVLRGAEALAARDGVASLADADLLRRFASDRDQAAFAVLVRRHGPLVWGVCRNLLIADADAEDAFQATFLALVRSAGTVRQTEALGGWLHGVAFRVAMKARRTAVRRKKREATAAVPEIDSPVPDAAWDELQAAVHEEVCRLPDKLRLPFVLCGLQGRQQKDVAKQLGWKVGTVSGRLTLARQRLLDRLARRGVPVGMAAGAAVLGVASGTAAVPHSVSAKAVAAAATPDAVSPVVNALARGVNPMYLTRTKLLIAGILMAGALTTGIGSRFASTAEAQAPPGEPSQEQLKKALDYLRTHQARDRWEYKFVPVDKPLVAADLQKLLSASDRDGWEYCGTQELVSNPKAKGAATPHMVFKRPRGATTVSDSGDSAKSAAFLAALALAAADDAKSADRANKLADAEKIYRAALESERRAQEEADRARVAIEAHEKALVESEQKRQIAEASRAAALAERVRSEELQKVIQQLRDEQKALMAKIRELEKGERPQAGNKVPDSTANRVVVSLRHVDADSAAKALEKIAPAGDYRATIDTRSNSLIIQGSPEMLDKLKAIIDKAVDVKPADDTKPAVDKLELAVFKLQHIGPKAALDAIAEVLGSTKLSIKTSYDDSTNSLFVAGSPEAVLTVRKVIETVDRPRTGKRP